MSSGRPEIPVDILDKWQRVIDLASKMANVPAGVIMKTDAPEHAGLLKCAGKDNPYCVGQIFVLGPKLYCRV